MRMKAHRVGSHSMVVVRGIQFNDDDVLIFSQVK